jgi:hypothetical protein
MALIFTLIVASLDRPVKLMISVIETVQLVELRVSASVPRHSDVLLTNVPVEVRKRTSYSVMLEECSYGLSQVMVTVVLLDVGVVIATSGMPTSPGTSIGTYERAGDE